MPQICRYVVQDAAGDFPLISQDGGERQFAATPCCCRIADCPRRGGRYRPGLFMVLGEGGGQGGVWDAVGGFAGAGL